MTDLPAVLAVDDVEANLIALEAELSRLDCEVVRARSGNEALKHLLRREFAVILLDVQMPGMDGYEVAQHARSNPATRDVPIVFVTALHETEEAVLRGYGAGAIDFLFKPINPHVLRAKVQVFLDLYLGRRRLADALAAQHETLAELEAFGYSVSHDLRAPLISLDGFSAALIEDHSAQLDATAQDYLRRIRLAAQRMSRLIDDLLRLSRMSRAEFSCQPVDLAALARSIVDELRRDEPARAVEFVVVDGATVQGDVGLLRAALENLLRNAWKFTRRQEPARIEFGARREDDRAVCFVRDNGVGFEPRDAHKLFQPFRRLHSDDEFEGNGIGLAIVQRVVRRHDGEVRAESEPGNGATFWFTLRDRG